MIKKLVKGGLAGGVILFLWGAFSWMVLPWHNMTMKQIGNEPEFAQFVAQNLGAKGVYFMPSNPHALGGPLVLAAVAPQGGRPMGQAMAIGFLLQVAAAFLLTFLIYEGNIPKYRDRVGCAVVFAVAAGMVTHLANWNWWNMPLDYTVVNMLDLAGGWFLAGLAIAKIVDPNPSA